MSYSTLTLSDLPRNTLSLVLSYLQQATSNDSTNDLKGPHNRDAISLLITIKRFAFAILPLFRLPKHLCRIHEYKVKKDGVCNTVVMVERYRFIMLPIQDPRTLLDRLNTRRLRRRIKFKKKQQQQLNHNCYQYGRTIEELSLEEWLMLQIHHRADKKLIKEGQLQIWPVHLELLRFNNCTFYDEHVCSKEDAEKKIKFKKLSRLLCRKPNGLTETDQNENWIPSCDTFGSDITLLSSYPRSGNTLMRTLLERITSTVTGSDTRPDRSLSISKIDPAVHM
jgi:hypothetical protein